MHRLHLSPFPFLPFPFSYEHSCLSPVHTLLRAFVCSTLPLFWDRLPHGYDFSLSLSLAHLFFCFSTGFSSLSQPLGRVVLRVPRAEPLFYIAATRRRPLVESRPAKESLRSLRIAPVHEPCSSFIARYSELHGTPSRTPPICTCSSTRDPGCEQDGTFRNSIPVPRAEAEGQWPSIDARKCSSIVESTDGF